MSDRCKSDLNNIIDSSRSTVQSLWYPIYVTLISAWVPKTLGSQSSAFISITEIFKER